MSTKCRYCGSTSYGSGCIHSPTRKHRHGPGGNKCIWCGSTSNGSGGTYAVTGARLAIVPRESTASSRIFADGIAIEPIEE